MVEWIHSQPTIIREMMGFVFVFIVGGFFIGLLFWYDLAWRAALKRRAQALGERDAAGWGQSESYWLAP